MIKILLCILIVITATLTGNSFSQRLTNRSKSLREILAAINTMKSLITFSGMDINQVVIDSFGKTALGNNFLLRQNEDENFNTRWRNTVSAIDKTSGLNKDDKSLLLSMGEGLGVTDITGQLAHLDLYAQLFAQCLSSAQEIEKEKGKLYRVLGFSLGCAVLLVVM